MWKVLVLLCFIDISKSDSPPYNYPPTAVSFTDRVDIFENAGPRNPIYNRSLVPKVFPYPYVSGYRYELPLENYYRSPRPYLPVSGYSLHPPFVASGYNYKIVNPYPLKNENKNSYGRRKEYLPGPFGTALTNYPGTTTTTRPIGEIIKNNKFISNSAEIMSM
ncbi:unnamed protein product [Brassicogethes aeneus]|uniref:Uncharacterized protein n=1 Tax=Brassicogethes aeneus TaxID=1431903 RepID=A0A9P0APR1_BRAAE|nr:unnamed protein product [Brassicogethes aeneus]